VQRWAYEVRMVAKECVRVTGELFLLFETHGMLLQWVRVDGAADAFGVRFKPRERRDLARALSEGQLPWQHPSAGLELRDASPGLRLIFRGEGISFMGREGTLSLGEVAAERLRAALAGELGDAEGGVTLPPRLDAH
jgi:hypothetical protein